MEMLLFFVEAMFQKEQKRIKEEIEVHEYLQNFFFFLSFEILLIKLVVELKKNTITF